MGICDASVCLLIVSSTSGIVFNQSAGALTDTANHRRTRTRILSPSSLEDPGHRKLVLILPNGMSKHGERAHDRNKFLLRVRFEPTTRSTVQRLTTRPPSRVATTTSNCFTLYFLKLRYDALGYVTFRYVALHSIAFRCVTLR